MKEQEEERGREKKRLTIIKTEQNEKSKINGREKKKFIQKIQFGIFVLEVTCTLDSVNQDRMVEK